MIWWTADTHFGHENVILHSKRPFGGLGEMTEAIISNWNERVGRGDVVYHLGDFCITWGKKSLGIVDELLRRCNGQKHLIIGNHDRKESYASSGWASAKHYGELKLDLGGVHKQRVVMSHYAMRTWNQMHRGSWMLHGHSHGNLTDVGGKTMDVGVDCNGYYPINIEQVKQFMDGRDIMSCDHHVPEVLPCPCGRAAGVIPDNSYGSCIIACSLEGCVKSRPIVDYCWNLKEGIKRWNSTKGMSGE